MAADHEDDRRVPATSLSVIRERVGATVIDAAHTTIADLGDNAPPGRAAVALVLREISAGPEILLIRRAERPHDPWSGHMAFPGGREDPADETLLATAVRETQEELGIDLMSSGRVIGRLEELQAMARGGRMNMVIVPFVFELIADAVLSYNGEEVAEALWVPIDDLMHGRLRTSFAYEVDGRRLELPAHDVQGRIVWGLTYRMLETLFAMLR